MADCHKTKTVHRLHALPDLPEYLKPNARETKRAERIKASEQFERRRREMIDTFDDTLPDDLSDYEIHWLCCHLASLRAGIETPHSDFDHLRRRQRNWEADNIREPGDRA